MAQFGRRRLWAIGGVVLLVALVFRPALNVAGYCWDEGRFLSEEEIISRVIQNTYDYYPPRNYGSSSGDIVKKPIMYKSLNHFILENKNCCRVVSQMDNGLKLTLFDRVFGRSAALVEIKFRVEAEAEHAGASTGMSSGVALGYGAVTNCGRVWTGI